MPHAPGELDHMLARATLIDEAYASPLAFYFSLPSTIDSSSPSVARLARELLAREQLLPPMMRQGERGIGSSSSKCANAEGLPAPLGALMWLPAFPIPNQFALLLSYFRHCDPQTITTRTAAKMKISTLLEKGALEGRRQSMHHRWFGEQRMQPSSQCHPDHLSQMQRPKLCFSTRSQNHSPQCPSWFCSLWHQRSRLVAHARPREMKMQISACLHRALLARTGRNSLHLRSTGLLSPWIGALARPGLTRREACQGAPIDKRQRGRASASATKHLLLRCSLSLAGLGGGAQQPHDVHPYHLPSHRLQPPPGRAPILGRGPPSRGA